MVYRFKIMSDEAPDFRLEIQINSDADFEQLRDALLHAAGYNALNETDVFFLCDDDWTPKVQVAIEDFGTDSDVDIYIMDETPLEDLIEDEGQKLTFCYDIDDPNRYLLLEMREMMPGKNLSEPLCTLRRGKAPSQHKPKPSIEVPSKNKPSAPLVDDLGLEFYGSDQYDADELPEGIEEDEEL